MSDQALMQTPTLRAGLSKYKLAAIFVFLILSVAVVINITLDSANKVSDKAQVLVQEILPELKEVTAIGHTLNKRIIDLYLYYATLEKPQSLFTEQVNQTFRAHKDVLVQLGYQTEQINEIDTLLKGFTQSVDDFDNEMKSSQRDWDKLRSILETAQDYGNQIDAIGKKWEQDIRIRAVDGGATTLAEIQRLNYLQLGFALAVAVVAFLVLVAVYARMQDQALLYRQVHEDGLTGLPNRASLIRDWQCHQAQAYTVVFISLDKFNMLTGIYGHQVGDKIICTVSEWIQARIEGSAINIYQFNADNWVLVIEDNKADVVSDIVNRVQNIAASPLSIGLRDFNLSCSIGVSHYPLDGDSLEDILRNADAAQRQVSESGGNACCQYEQQMNERMQRSLAIETDLHSALEEDAFELNFQPKYCASDSSLAGFEVLLRWNNKGENISPGEFIPIAEQSVLIVSIGEWVLKNACIKWVEWQQQGLTPVPMAVNISAQHFAQKDFAKHVEQVLKDTGMPAKFLELEITEEAAANQPQEVANIMHNLKRIGISIALDDFGTGYSSLAYLMQFPLDVLKIDRSFVNQMHESAGDLAIVHMVMSLAHQLNLKVVAEGVETLEQQNTLVDLKCEYLQGYLLDKPLIAADFQTRLEGLDAEVLV